MNQQSSNDLVPSQGSIPRPNSREEGLEGLIEQAFPRPDKVVEVVCTCFEFTSNCPKTGQPDFGEVTIKYLPKRLCIESRSLKFYLWSYRNAGAFCEALASQIAEDIHEAVDPKYVEVTVRQNSRGGIGLVSTARLYE